MLLNFRPHLKKVTIEFEDGSVESFDVVPPCGFMREEYTYQQAERSHKVTAVIHTYEVFWVEKKESSSAYDFRTSTADR